MKAEDLREIGFNLNEAKIYLILLEYGSLQAGQISKKTQINRRTIYDTIERLIEKGYISYSIIANKRVFKASNPDFIIEKIKAIEKQAQNLLPQLKNTYETTKEEQEANIYRGRKGVRSILNDILKQKEYVVFGSNENFPDVMQHDFSIFQKRKKELKIKSKTIMSISMKGKSVLKEAFTTYKFIPEPYSIPTSTFIYCSKVAIIIWSELPIGMVVENKDIANSFRKYFGALWKFSKS
ncbi:MAG: helix-turn-helix domain-containing protein [Candidatus Nanoarchaeia archaeon]|nr:helix-turn-helix domain-containing protein [Candidatus Nanoarchaeia archaeon]